MTTMTDRICGLTAGLGAAALVLGLASAPAQAMTAEEILMMRMKRFVESMP